MPTSQNLKPSANERSGIAAKGEKGTASPLRGQARPLGQRQRFPEQDPTHRLQGPLLAQISKSPWSQAHRMQWEAPEPQAGPILVQWGDWLSPSSSKTHQEEGIETALYPKRATVIAVTQAFVCHNQLGATQLLGVFSGEKKMCVA